MRIKHYQIAGILAAFITMAPNIGWNVYLPVISFFCVHAFFLTKFSQMKIVGLCGFLLLLLIISFFLPYTTKYNLFFFLILVFSIEFKDLIKDEKFAIFLLKFGSYFLPATILIAAFLPIEELLQNRPEFDNYLFGFLRQRGLFTEPAFLGYWSAFYGYLCLTRRRYYLLFIYGFILFLSASAGAILFFASLLLTLLRQVRIKELILLGGFGAIIFVYLYDHIALKLSSEVSLSLINRVENTNFTLEYIIEKFPLPGGFGPIFYDSYEIGITAFILLLIKALGIFAIIFIPIFLRLSSFPIAILPVLMLFLAVGSFWEAPILIVLFYFASINYKSRSGRDFNKQSRNSNMYLSNG